METKAQIAAKEQVNAMIEYMSNRVLSPDTHFISIEEVFAKVEEVRRIIEEYALDNKLLNNAVEKVYKCLMKEKRYGDAASLAKKYSL